jgi:hypothetical protein
MLEEFFYMLDLMNNPWVLYHVLPYHVAFVLTIVAFTIYVWHEER